MWFCMHVETAYFLNWLPHKNDKTNTYGVEIIFNTKPWLAQTRKNISEHRPAYFVKKKKKSSGHGPETNIFLRLSEESDM